MVYKHLAVLAAVLILGGMLATPAVAHQLTVANASINCGGGCLNLTATDLTPGDMDKITFTFVLTPVSGGSPITVSGEVDFTASSSTYSNTVCGNCLSSGNLSDNFTVTGTATLTTPSDTSTLTIDLGGQDTLNCGGSSFSWRNPHGIRLLTTHFKPPELFSC